jgi:hypothetical protein
MSDQLNAETSTCTTQNRGRRQVSKPAAGLEPAIPAKERPQTHPLDLAATGTGPLYSEQRISWPPEWLATTEKLRL